MGVPDLATHYAIGLLLVSRIERSWVRVVLLALAALAPDVDALFGVHRWFTHSLVVAAPAFSLVALAAIYSRRSLLRYVAVVALLYTLHIALDLFTAPTPVLWPLVNQSLQIQLAVTGVISSNEVTVEHTVNVIGEPVNFNTREAVEGPILTVESIPIPAATIIVLLLENTGKHRGRQCGA